MQLTILMCQATGNQVVTHLLLPRLGLVFVLLRPLDDPESLLRPMRQRRVVRLQSA